MTAQIIDGKAIAQISALKWRLEVTKRTAGESSGQPLATVLVGDRALTQPRMFHRKQSLPWNLAWAR